MTDPRQISVTCYSGHTFAQEPRAFDVGHERRTVTTLRKKWREPSGPCFEVLADDGVVYVLAYDEAADAWHISAAMAQSRSHITEQLTFQRRKE